MDFSSQDGPATAPSSRAALNNKIDTKESSNDRSLYQAHTITRRHSSCRNPVSRPGIRCHYHLDRWRFRHRLDRSRAIGLSDILEIGAGTPKRFVGSTFTNLSFVRWLADPLQGGNGAVVTNAGVWRSESDANSLNWTFGGQALFINTGTFSKSVGTTTNVGTWLFRNDGGIIEAQTGSIVFNSASNIFNNGSRFTGAGKVEVSGGASFNGNLESDNLVFSGGSQVGTAAALTGGRVCRPACSVGQVAI